MPTNSVPSRDNWTFGSKKNVLKDKKFLIDQYIRYMLIRTQSMFEYKNLPESIPQREIELLLQTHGFVIFKRVKGELYVFYGGLGGIPNQYYLPTQAIVTNPYLKYYEKLEVDKDCVVMWNDVCHIGLMPMNLKYATLLAETDISMRLGCVNSRIVALLKAYTDNAKASAEEIIKKIDEGEELNVISCDPATKGVESIDYSGKSSTNIKELIELQQYLKGSWYNEIGINANFNMKREAINSNESSLNEDALLPLCDDMLKERKIALDKVNAMYGTNIEIDFSSSWKKLRVQIEKALEDSEQQPSNAESGEKEDETIGND